jgi:hypothetical protein
VKGKKCPSCGYYHVGVRQRCGIAVKYRAKPAQPVNREPVNPQPRAVEPAQPIEAPPGDVVDTSIPAGDAAGDTPAGDVPAGEGGEIPLPPSPADIGVGSVGDVQHTEDNGAPLAGKPATPKGGYRIGIGARENLAALDYLAELAEEPEDRYPSMTISEGETLELERAWSETKMGAMVKSPYAYIAWFNAKTALPIVITRFAIIKKNAESRFGGLLSMFKKGMKGGIFGGEPIAKNDVENGSKRA